MRHVVVDLVLVGGDDLGSGDREDVAPDPGARLIGATSSGCSALPMVVIHLRVGDHRRIQTKAHDRVGLPLQEPTEGGEPDVCLLQRAAGEGVFMGWSLVSCSRSGCGPAHGV